MEETVQLLADLGLRDGSAFESNGITGGELLELDSTELREDLQLTHLQVCTKLHDRPIAPSLHMRPVARHPMLLASVLLC